MKEIIVKFKNGQYGLRSGDEPSEYRFRDLTNPNFSWPIDSQFMRCCKDTLEMVEKVVEVSSDPGEPFKEKGGK